MKSNKVFSAFKNVTLTLVLFLTFACTSTNTEKTNDNADESISVESTSTECLLGVWSCNDNGQILTFVFEDDKKGYENIGEEDRIFSYTLKEGNPIITYAGEENEWELTLDCNENILSVFGLKYKKG